MEPLASLALCTRKAGCATPRPVSSLRVPGSLLVYLNQRNTTSRKRGPRAPVCRQTLALDTALCAHGSLCPCGRAPLWVACGHRPGPGDTAGRHKSSSWGQPRGGAHKPPKQGMKDERERVQPVTPSEQSWEKAWLVPPPPSVTPVRHRTASVPGTRSHRSARRRGAGTSTHTGKRRRPGQGSSAEAVAGGPGGAAGGRAGGAQGQAGPRGALRAGCGGWLQGPTAPGDPVSHRARPARRGGEGKGVALPDS